MRALVLIALLAACSPAPQKAEAPTAPAAESAAAPNTQEAALAQMPAWADARTAGVDFRAVGQEPGWMLDIYQRDRITFLWNYGENIAHFPLTEPTYPQEGATRYELQTEGHTLRITIRRFPCQDVMSGEAYPSAVEIVIDGTTLNGCGRSV